MSNLDDYSTSITKSRFIPSNEYEHADGLIHSDLEKKEENLQRFSMIVDKHIQLCNIGNDVLMRHYQIDANLLTHLFSMSEREPEMLKDLTKVLFFAWRSEMLLTKTHKGAERKFQASVGTKFETKERLGGYGDSYEIQDSQKEQNILSGLFSKKKEKRYYQ